MLRCLYIYVKPEWRERHNESRREPRHAGRRGPSLPAAARGDAGMLTPAVSLASIALAIHIAAVVVAFAPLFAFPVLVAAVRRSDPSALAAVYRVQNAVARGLITPALPAMLVAGLYLAADEHAFGKAWVIVPMVVIVVLMALHRLVLLEGYRRLGSGDQDAGPRRREPSGQTGETGATALRWARGVRNHRDGGQAGRVTRSKR